MSVFMRQILGLAVGGLVMATAFAGQAQAAPLYTPVRPVNRPVIVYPQYTGGIRVVGWDWQPTYRRIPYNAWQYPYPPYSSYYPYPYYPVPRPYPLPLPAQSALPWDIGSGAR